MQRKVSWVVMGLGLQGNRLIRTLQQSSNAVLVGTASERERRSYARALKNTLVDAVAIATPNDQHAPQVIAAAKAGKDILCEKPLTLSLQEGRRMQHEVKKSGVRCFVNYHLRMHPEVTRARQLIAKKKLGVLTYIEMQWSIGDLAQTKLPPLPSHMRWRENPKKAGGGALMARGTHLFDLLRFITSKEVVAVYGWSDATKYTVDRTMVSICILEGGIPVVITTSKAMPNTDNHITIYGMKKNLALRNVFQSDPNELYRKVFDAVTNARQGKKTALATLEDGIAAVQLAEAFTRSASSGRTVSL